MDVIDILMAKMLSGGSGGGGGGSVTVDSALSDSSTNPVQNKVVKAALDNKQDTLTAGQNVTISGNTISADVDSAEIASNVTAWLDDNVTPVGSAVVVDSSLSVSSAAADAKVTGDITNRIAEDIDLISGGNQNMMPAIKPGFYASADGSYNGTRRDYVCSADLFPVQEGDELSLIGEVKYNGWYLNKFDSNGTYVSSQSYAKTVTSATIPSGVGLVGLSFNFGSAADRTIDDVPAVYINYDPYAQPHRTVAERLNALESAQELIGYGYSPIYFTAAAGWRGSQNNFYNTAGHYHVDIPVTEGEKYHVKTRTNNAEIKGASWFPSDFNIGTEALAGNASDYIDGYLTVPSGAAYLTVNCAHAYSVVIEKYGLLSEAETGLPTYFADEVDSVVATTKGHCTEKALVLAAVTDSHLNANYGYQVWNDTVKNMLAVNEEYQLDGVLHLGDMISGDNTAAVGKEQLDLIRNGFRVSYPDAAYFDGNHDTNTFYGESMDDPITEAQMYSEMFRFNAIDIVRPDGKLYGYKDYDALGIRVVYLHSSMGDGTHGGQGTNWGYPSDELTWVQNVALDTEYQVLLLSHMPITEGYISNSATLPNNGNALKTIINSFISNGGVVIGLFHGHTHWDDIQDNGTFKEVSIGCEAYQYTASDVVGTAIHSYTPASAVRPARMRYTVTQDLWDVVIVRPASRTVKLVRFGAGVDRAFSY